MNRQLIVSGFHRSGTSMMMQALVNAGLHAGNSLIGADPSNPDGHFEDVDTVNLHDTWLQEHDSDWCHWGELPPIDSAAAASGIKPIQERLNEAQLPWGIKDPRACLFLEHWFNLLDNPGGVFTYRHYASCLHSLQRRHANELLVNPDIADSALRLWTHPDMALKSWLVHNNSILAAVKKYPDQCVVIAQSAAITGAPVISIVNDALSMSLNSQSDTGIDATKSAQRKILPVLNTGLQTQLEHTWNHLQQIAAAPSEQRPQVQWIDPQSTEVGTQAIPSSLIYQWDRLGVAMSQSV